MSRSRTLPPMITLAEDLNLGHRSTRPELALVPRKPRDSRDAESNRREVDTEKRAA